MGAKAIDQIRSLPKKETVEFAKNFTFAVTLQAVSMSLLTPHQGQAPGLEHAILSSLTALVTGFVTVFSAVVYIESFKTPLSSRGYWTVIAFCLVAMFAAGQVTKEKLLELAASQSEKAPHVAGLRDVVAGADLRLV